MDAIGLCGPTVQPAAAIAPMSTASSSTRNARLAALAAVLLCAAAIWPAAFTSSRRSRAAYDQINYHEKVVRTFAQELPNPNLRDYLSATTPGYHLVLAAVGRVLLGPNLHAGVNLTPDAADPHAAPLALAIARERLVLQLTGGLFTLAWVGLLVWWAARRCGAHGTTAALVCVLPVAASPYVWQSGAFMLPDNSAWLAVTGVLLASLAAVQASTRATWRWLALAGLLAFASVWLRQIHLWTAGVVWAAAALSAAAPLRQRGPLLAVSDALPLRTTRKARWLAHLGLGIALTLPAFASVAWFASIWGGLVPPSFKLWYTTGVTQPGASAFILTLIAAYGVFFAGWWWPAAKAAWTSHRAALLLSALIGLALALIGPTEPGFQQGRFGGLWSIVALVPSVLGRAPLVAAGAVAGAVLVAVLLAGMAPRQRWIMLAALVGFAAAQTANEQLWQRYNEPMVLLWLVLACVLGSSRTEDTRLMPTWRVIGPLALALGLAAVTALGFARSGVAHDEGLTVGQVPPSPAQAAPVLRP